MGQLGVICTLSVRFQSVKIENGKSEWKRHADGLKTLVGEEQGEIKKMSTCIRRGTGRARFREVVQRHGQEALGSAGLPGITSYLDRSAAADLKANL